MPVFEFSDGFDAQGWYAEQMLKGYSFESDEDPYGWDDSPDYDMSDVEADADTLASAGWGTDEDYGYYGGEDAAMEAGLFGWDA